MSENKINLGNHVLVCIDVSLNEAHLNEYQYLRSNFCGRVLDEHREDFASSKITSGASQGTLYFCGNVQLFQASNKDAIGKFELIKVIKELSYDAESIPDIEYVTLGEVNPSNIPPPVTRC